MNDPKTTLSIPIDQLKFDPENPRLPSSLDGGKEKDVLRWMLEKETIPELMGAIGERGYFDGEPLLVVPAGKKGNTYTVVEGNRRLAAVKLLLDPQKAPVRLLTI